MSFNYVYDSIANTQRELYNLNVAINDRNDPLNEVSNESIMTLIVNLYSLSVGCQALFAMLYQYYVSKYRHATLAKLNTMIDKTVKKYHTNNGDS